MLDSFPAPVGRGERGQQELREWLSDSALAGITSQVVPGRRLPSREVSLVLRRVCRWQAEW